MELLKIVSSQLKLRPETPETEIDSRRINKASCLKNEPFSFQALYRSTPQNPMWGPVSITVKCDLPLSVYRVDWSAVANAINIHHEAGFEGDAPGLYPNPLMPRSAVPEIQIIGPLPNWHGELYEKNHLNADPTFRSLWITLNPESKTVESGTYPVEITLISLIDGSVSARETFEIEVIDAVLPRQKVFYTNWFNIDCLCDRYKVEPYSDEFYEYFESFISNAALHRQNTLLTPAFTPPLDLPAHHIPRRNVQLVEVSVENGEYKFGFEKLLKFLKTAEKCGITYFEHSHLFSQDGPIFAIDVYDVDGKAIFNNNMPADGGEYRKFINEYLKAFLNFAEANGYADRFVFHISDEPPLECLDAYRAAFDSVRDVLKGKTVIDALSNIEFYREVPELTPVPFINHADEFSAECDNFWVYYTGSPLKGCTNRLITTTAARERVLGLQLYFYGAKGFLHWGYNFYYNSLSAGRFDPLSNPCGYKNMPGVSFLAYPTEDGAVPSICEKIMLEAMDDVRALELLESFIGKKSVIDFCETVLGDKISYKLIPEKEDMFRLRQLINEEIKKHIR